VDLGLPPLNHLVDLGLPPLNHLVDLGLPPLNHLVDLDHLLIECVLYEIQDSLEDLNHHLLDLHLLDVMEREIMVELQMLMGLRLVVHQTNSWYIILL
jgi:hypothetical protein